MPVSAQTCVYRHACNQRTQFMHVRSSLRRPRDIVARQIDLICAPQLVSAEANWPRLMAVNLKSIWEKPRPRRCIAS